jgi:dihydrofolate reductase
VEEVVRHDEREIRPDPARRGAPVRRLILEEWLSLDGYAVDSEGTLDFFPESEVDRFSDRDKLAFLEGVDTILLGRRTYELFVDYWPTATTDTEIIADRLNELPKLVFSNTLGEAPWGTWPPARVVRGEAVSEIERLKKQDGKHMVLWGSLSLCPGAHRGRPHRRVSLPALSDAGRRGAVAVPRPCTATRVSTA